MTITKKLFRCYNLACQADPHVPLGFEFWSDTGECPKCYTRPPITIELEIVHLLVRDNNGPILGSSPEFKRWAVACQRSRPYLSTPAERFPATPVVEAVNCPLCLKATEIE